MAGATDYAGAVAGGGATALGGDGAGEGGAAEAADGEVGRLDFDPYIDGQDYQITDLKFGDAQITGTPRRSK